MRPDADPTAHGWLPGEVLAGKYRILERIGAGGMGAVHAARRLSLGDVVAIKSILPDRSNARNRARFLREARALARIRHPNVVQVFDYGEAGDGSPFMVMEYVDGPTLARVLAGGRIPLTRALELFADICRAVEAGHRRGVVHRDLKPGNVMIARSDDGAETVKVLDFGLARVADEDDLERSRAGALVGTCAYMSPETIEQGAGGPAGDVFALGVMLYEVVTGELPFRGANAIATIMQICEGAYRPAHERVPELPETVTRAIDAALQRSPTDRPASAIELATLALGRDSSPASSGPASSGLDSWSATGPLRSACSPRAAEPRARERPGPTLDGFLTEEVEPEPARRPSSPARAEALFETVDGSQADSAELSRDAGTHEPETLVRDSGDSQRDSSRVRASLAAPPFVGRKLELDTLLELLAASARDEVPIAVVLGEPGMGRTRLLRRFAELAREWQAVVYEGRFWGYDGERAPAGEVFGAMLEAGGQAEPRNPLAAGTMGTDRRSGFAALARRFEAEAGDRALVLVLDDLQHASSRDLEFLTYLVRGGQRAVPVVIVASARSEAARSDAGTELSRWLLQLAGLKARTTLSLGPFDEDQLRAWLEATFGRLRIRPRDLRRLEQASAGNPYFLSELVRHLVAGERIHRAEDGLGSGWVCERLARDVLPEGLASIVADQLASLPKPLRELLETAAVIGEPLRLELLERAMGLDEDTLDELIDAAVARDLLSEAELEAGADLRFRSATVRQVLYDRLGKRKRKRVHRAVVEALRSLADGRRHAQVLARHYRAIGEWPETLNWGLRAAREALARHDHDAAELALEHAAAAIEALSSSAEPPRPRARLRLAALGGTLDARVGRYDEGATRLREARLLLERHAATLEQDQDSRDPGRPLPYLRFEIALSLARCQLGLGQLEEAAAVGREALELALVLPPAQTGGDEGRLEAEWDARVALGHTLGRFGDWAGAAAILDPVVDGAPLPSLRALHMLGLRERGWLAARSGDLAAADRYAARARAEAKAGGEPLADYCAASLSGVAYSARGESRLAVRHYREALRRARSLSLRRREMIEQANLCMSLVDLGEYDQAFQHMLSVRAICRELGDVASAADARVGLARILRGRGDLDEAIDSFRRGHQACEAVGRHEYAAIALLELGRCELDRGQWAAAREVLELARERFAALPSLHQWEVELGLARAARGLGDELEARERAAAAQALLEDRRHPLPARKDAALRDVVDRGLAQVQAFLAERG